MCSYFHFPVLTFPKFLTSSARKQTPRSVLFMLVYSAHCNAWSMAVTKKTYFSGMSEKAKNYKYFGSLDTKGKDEEMLEVKMGKIRQAPI